MNNDTFPPPSRTLTRERIKDAQDKFGPSDRARVQTLLALLAYFGSENHEATYRAIFEDPRETGDGDEGSGSLPPLALQPTLASLLHPKLPKPARKPLPSATDEKERKADDTAGAHQQVEDAWRRTP